MRVTMLPKLPTQFSKQINQALARARAVRFRTRHKVTMTQVAAMSGISLPMIHCLEEGKRQWTEKHFALYVGAVKDAANQNTHEHEVLKTAVA